MIKLLAIIVMLAVIRSSLGCSCRFVNVEHYFCNADFVIKANITGKTVIKTEADRIQEQNPPPFSIIYFRLTSYDIDVLEVYKANERVGTVLEGDAKIWVNKIASQCGIGYSQGDVYVIAGGIKDNKLWAPACGYSKMTRWMDSKDKKFFDQQQYKTFNCSSLTGPF